MARPGLSHHPKFLLLAQRLGSAVLARGHLELLWECSYDTGNPFFVDSDSVEAAARWSGEPGELTGLLIRGFLDVVGNSYEIHDFWDHAPSYVLRRAKREAARHKAGVTISDLRRQAAETRWNRTPETMQTDASGEPLNASGMQTAQLPTPNSQLPTPKKKRKSLVRPEQEIDFQRFYSAYPLHVKRAEALKAWQQKIKEERLPALADLLAIVEVQKGWWNDPTYIPHPSTWLRGERWADEAAPRNGTPGNGQPPPDPLASLREDALHHIAMSTAPVDERVKANGEASAATSGAVLESLIERFALP